MMHVARERKKEHYREMVLDSFLGFFGVLGIMTILYIMYGYAPFGNNSLACSDANIQYLDFFAYFLDVLKGKNSLTQTFSSFLGGNNIGVFGYYLASPFNLLVLLFDKPDLHGFFDILAAVKMAMAAATFCLFLHVRFIRGRAKFRIRMFGILLSLGYALSQYAIAQSSNIMWLDGVYMLPLVLAGVYYIVRRNSGWLLAISVGMSILFNWYTGAINCFFSGGWICFEIALNICNIKRGKEWGLIRQCCKYIVQYLFSMVTGVLISMILFWPTVLVMRNSGRGELEFAVLKDLSFAGSIPSVIQGYALGAKSSYGNVSLFCGSLALLGCVCCLVSKRVPLKTRMVFGMMLGGVVLLFYWKPLCAVFSLFKPVNSYWYRYSYVGIVSILFLAAYFWIEVSSEVDRRDIWLTGISSAGMLVLLDYLRPSQNAKLTYFTAFFIVLTAIVLGTVFSVGKQVGGYGKFSYIACCALAVLELAYGVKLQMYNYHTSDVEAYQKYVFEQEQRINAISLEEKDKIYRISQTTTRNHNEDMNRTANYNEALAYGYASISGYVSAPDEKQIDLLNRMGYRCESGLMTIVNTSLLGADSLLDVKYVLSKYPVNGLMEVQDIVQKGEKRVYENPFYLPFAFTYDDGKFNGEDETSIVDSQNPFEYQNILYSRLMGEKVELYKPLFYSRTESEQGNGLLYSLQVPAGRWAVYGNFPWQKQMDALINVNHVYKMAYSKWLSPSVFYIPTDHRDKEETVVIELTAANRDGLKEGVEQFYALDLEVLRNVSSVLRAREADVLIAGNGKASFEVEANKDSSLFVSIPYERGWNVKNNGEEITVNLFAECMYSIPLQEGRNCIEMTYHLPGAEVGLIGTMIGGVLILGMFLMQGNGKTFTKIIKKG